MCRKCVNYKTCPVGIVPDSEECKRSRSLDGYPKVKINVPIMNSVMTYEEIRDFMKKMDQVTKRHLCGG